MPSTQPRAVATFAAGRAAHDPTPTPEFGEVAHQPTQDRCAGFLRGWISGAEISTDFKRRLYAPVDAADKESDRTDFAMAIYPGHLATDANTLNPNVLVTRDTPPTFLVQAEYDYIDGVKQSLIYYMALAKVRLPAEMHMYARVDMHLACGPRDYRSRIGRNWLTRGYVGLASSGIDDRTGERQLGVENRSRRSRITDARYLIPHPANCGHKTGAIIR